MSTVRELRAGRSSGATVVAAASTLVPITLVAWITWQVIEADRETLTSSEFSPWAVVTLGAAVLVGVVAGVFWRSSRTRAGSAVGILLAVVAVLAGLLVDIVGSGGLA
ncbi:MAG TPA: hypothetical protein VD864_00590 [Nocardioides sp.]|nr:hypothetical protein [Nocardioides sp.]